MQFVSNGPDVPEALLQAHEAGRVVFFCGAGISYAAGLPLFKGLVQDVFQRTGMSMNRIEESAFKGNQYDVTLGLLEGRHQGGRLEVRRAMAKALKPNLRKPGALITHNALLDLARDRFDAVRLVTTNFDSIFEALARRHKQRHNVFQAPLLPVPKNSKWDGVVYLHGLLPEEPNDAALNRLVVTSGDFGLAYLTERWAARFVSELFRSYVVCFVGYSINDPVLRYMMDALAADRLQGERTVPAYLFGSCRPGGEDAAADDWKAKGVQPILYRVRVGANGKEDHSALPRTLDAWARTYKSGSLGKERIVVEYAQANPSENTVQDDFVGRMLWALVHQDGLPAKRFADLDPAPPLTWLSALTDTRFRHSDLGRFGVPAHDTEDPNLAFSLVRRPSPYQLAPQMAIGHMHVEPGAWDPVMHHLARWLMRHLNDPNLLLWLVEQGPIPHPTFGAVINKALKDAAKLQATANSADLEAVLSRSPNSVPGPTMRGLWRVYASGMVKSPHSDVDVFDWLEHYQQEGLTRTVRLELRRLLSPRVAMRRSWRQANVVDQVDEADAVRNVIEWELVLSGDDVRTYVQDVDQSSELKGAFPALLTDFEQMLGDALAVMVELGIASHESDRSNWDLPSIEPHWQNRGFRDWIVLIELLRDAWLAVRSANRSRARAIAQGWFGRPHATFKRLALFAASHNATIEAKEWVSWLLADGRRWLWSSETGRECMRLLVLQGAHLPHLARARLEAGILKGPPRKLYRDGIDRSQWKRIIDHSTWLRLAKLKSSGIKLSRQAQGQLDKLTNAHPDWRLAEDQSDEFSHWMVGTGDEAFEDSRTVERAPRIRRQLVDWLRKSNVDKLDPFHEDTWLDTCRTRFRQSASALARLADEDVWPAERWRVALQAWSSDLAAASWRGLAPVVARMPDDVFKEVSRGIAWWLNAAAKSVFRHRSIFIRLCHRILAFDHVSGTTGDRPVTDAINHPVGHVAQALLAFWFRRDPNDDDGIPPSIAELFTSLCDGNRVQYRHGRVILASRMVAMFRIDHIWTQTHLLPLFDWDRDPVEAGAAWEGFLWSPRIYRPLMAAFKKSFLITAAHYQELGEHKGQYASFLTYAALTPLDDFKPTEFKTAVEQLPQDGLGQVAHTLAQAQASAGDQREEYWRTRAAAFWRDVWPKDRKFASRSIAYNLALLCLEAGDEFPVALDATIAWLKPIQGVGTVVNRIKQRNMATRFPDTTLKLLDRIVGADSWSTSELRQCLSEIASSKVALKSSAAFLRLNEHIRSKGE